MMRSHTLFVLLALASGCGAPLDRTELDEIEGTASEPLIGATNQIDNHPFSGAAAWVNFFTAGNADAGSCSGTLVAPNKVITAAHCFCGAVSRGVVRFADATGNIPSSAPSFNFNVWAIPPDVNPCFKDDFDDWEEDVASDIAVITLQPPFPTATPAEIFLGHPEIAVETGRLNQTWWSIGYGNAAPLGTPGCVGCGIRRSGAWRQLRTERDPCSFFPVEFECWDDVLWSANSIEEGNSLECTNGDSGGPLFFNVDSPLPPVVAGAFSHGGEDEDGFSRWATFGFNADFLWGALGLPYTLTLAQQRAGTAVYAKRSLRINDRAHVEVGGANNIGARVVASLDTGNVRIGVEAFVGDVRARSPIFLEDRSFVGNVYSSVRVNRGNNITVAAQPPLSAEFQTFEGFDIASPFAPSNTTTNVGPSGGNLTMAPGIHGNTTVYGNRTLTLSAGLHIFNSLQLESNSILALGPGPTWVFINAGGSLILRGQVLGTAGNNLIAAPNARDVAIGNNFRGTLVAPRASVSADMVTNATLVGAFFVNDFELHQGRFLFFVPNTRNWVPTCTGGGGFTNCN